MQDTRPVTGDITVTNLGRVDPDGPIMLRLESTVPRDIRLLRKSLAAAGHWSATDGESNGQPYSLRCYESGAAAVAATEQMQAALLDAT